MTPEHAQKIINEATAVEYDPEALDAVTDYMRDVHRAAPDAPTWDDALRVVARIAYPNGPTPDQLDALRERREAMTDALSEGERTCTLDAILDTLTN
ncbi:MAG: hypothetical protein Unbinned7015contig1001_26 [Prokaryotic dsDNA virus sp.]|nr:MAG: hypothetical protein Unbinned7015contig1001_26 [Prokaryotic dsDNA virus sp.]|tara:strand:+ start:7496 stop:7786 length:291 start_codon:yes stop_codon:yes gene_type:complete